MRAGTNMRLPPQATCWLGPQVASRCKLLEKSRAAGCAAQCNTCLGAGTALLHRSFNLVARGLRIRANEVRQLLNVCTGRHRLAGSGCRGWGAGLGGKGTIPLSLAGPQAMPGRATSDGTALQALDSLYSVGLEGQSNSIVSGCHSCAAEAGAAAAPLRHSGQVRIPCSSLSSNICLLATVPLQHSPGPAEPIVEIIPGRRPLPLRRQAQIAARRRKWRPGPRSQQRSCWHPSQGLQ